MLQLGSRVRARYRATEFGKDRTKLATFHTGECERCVKDLEKVAADPFLKGIAKFSARNNMDLLYGLHGTPELLELRFDSTLCRASEYAIDTCCMSSTSLKSETEKRM